MLTRCERNEPLAPGRMRRLGSRIAIIRVIGDAALDSVAINISPNFDLLPLKRDGRLNSTIQTQLGMSFNSSISPSVKVD
jgi:hypothetical protein